MHSVLMDESVQIIVEVENKHSSRAEDISSGLPIKTNGAKGAVEEPHIFVSS